MKRTVWNEGTEVVEVKEIRELTPTEKSDLYRVQLDDGRSFLLSFSTVLPSGQAAFDAQCNKLGADLVEFSGQANLTVIKTEKDGNSYTNFRLEARTA